MVNETSVKFILAKDFVASRTKTEAASEDASKLRMLSEMEEIVENAATEKPNIVGWILILIVGLLIIWLVLHFGLRKL